MTQQPYLFPDLDAARSLAPSSKEAAARRIPLPRAKLVAMDRLYARLPKLECKRLCQECCGPVFMSRLEGERIRQTAGDVPRFDDALTCTMLKPSTGLCRVYHQRPLLCRLWGLVEKMRCPFGCIPDRWLSDAEAKALLHEAERIGG